MKEVNSLKVVQRSCLLDQTFSTTLFVLPLLSLPPLSLFSYSPYSPLFILILFYILAFSPFLLFIFLLSLLSKYHFFFTSNLIELTPSSLFHFTLLSLSSLSTHPVSNFSFIFTPNLILITWNWSEIRKKKLGWKE